MNMIVICMMPVPMVPWKALNDTKNGLNQVIKVYITTFKAQFVNVSVLNEFVFPPIGTKLAERFSDLVLSTQMKKDVPKLSPSAQTAALEGFHDVVNHFAPKKISFSYHGMLSR